MGKTLEMIGCLFLALAVAAYVINAFTSGTFSFANGCLLGIDCFFIGLALGDSLNG